MPHSPASKSDRRLLIVIIEPVGMFRLGLLPSADTGRKSMECMY